MSGGFPTLWNICNGHSVGGGLGTGTPGTTVTSGAINTKGSWTQITASCPIDTCFVGVAMTSPGGTLGLVQSMDIGIGPSGSEVILIADLLLESTVMFQQFLLPLTIPSGVRISARTQAATASSVARIWLQLFDGSFDAEGVAGCDTYGFNSSTSEGTSVTLGNNSKGSYAEITPSTTNDYCGICLGLQANPANGHYSSDLAIGPSGSETIIIPDIYFSSAASGGIHWCMSNFYPVGIPAGSRLAFRGVGTSSATVA